MIKIKGYIIICCCFLFMLGCDGKDNQADTSVRPSDFPIDVFPLENAEDIRYESYKTAKLEDELYVMSYTVIEKHPAQKTIDSIRADFNSKGYVKVVWDSDDFVVYTNENGMTVLYKDDDGNDDQSKIIEGVLFEYSKNETEEYREALDRDGILKRTEWSESLKPKIGKPTLSTWTESWVAQNDILVDVLLHYGREGEKKDDKLYVSFYVHTPLSYKNVELKKYKSLHPEKFNE